MYLQLENIFKNYNEKEVLKNINFEITEGQLVCVLGPSGCGKTTLLNIIGGFIEDFSGKIFIDNTDITNVPPERRPVATVFQSYGLFTHKNVIENVSYGLKFLKLSKKEILVQATLVLKKVGLAGYQNKYISELSGGEQQRVAIARSLVLQPKVLLLDEPFSNLDVHLRGAMRDEVRRIQKEFGVTMNNGEIEQIGTPQELYSNPKTEFVSKFIGESNLSKDGHVLRPERIKLKKDNNQENTILEKFYLGATVEYKVQTEKYGYLKVLTLSSEEAFEIGDKVEVIIK